MRARAVELGFDAVGVASAERRLEDDFAHYEAFLQAGFHGSMGYLARHREVRRSLADPGILPGARSVICVAMRYAVRSPSGQSGLVEGIAKYARGRDYHNHVRRRLRKLADFVRALQPGAAARPMVDTAPVLERAWAARSGIGFVGKNGMLICPGLGSYTVLGEVVTTVSLTPGQPMAGRCGRCTACIDACPSGAIVRPYVVDARRCISYLTIEHRGAWGGEDRSGVIAPRLFGCDTCQDVCPFNRARGAWIEPGGPFDPLDRWLATSRAEILTMSETRLARLLDGSAARRVSWEDWRRNVIASWGNQTPAASEPVLRAVASDPRTPPWLERMALAAVASARAPGHGQRS